MNDPNDARHKLDKDIREKGCAVVAKQAGITPVALSYWMHGKIRFRFETIQEVAHAVGYHLDVKLRKR